MRQFNLPMNRAMNQAEKKWVKSHAASWKLINTKRKRCKACKTGNKTPFMCSVCKKGTCPEHSKLICTSCE